MLIFDYMQKYDYEELVLCQDQASGLKAIIAIHDTTLGPALGGTRMWTYASEDAAIEDALRLSKAMTYKNAVAGLNLGGGKAVVIGDPYKDKNEAMFRAYGRYIEGLAGRYITAEDVGTTVEDMDTIHLETQFVTGISPEFGSSGNPSPMTALGIYRGLQATCTVAYGDKSLKNKVIAVQGMGSVAQFLCEYLHKEGAKLIITDINQDRVQQAADRYEAEVVGVDDIYDVDCDIFSPCALGGIINDQTVDKFKCKIIAGAANAQLQDNSYGQVLEKKGIIYAPDYVINAGGVINVADELLGYNRDRAVKKINNIYDNILKVFNIAKRDNIAANEAADRLAEERIAAVGRTRTIYLRK